MTLVVLPSKQVQAAPPEPSTEPTDDHYTPNKNGDVPKVLTPENAKATVESFGGTKGQAVSLFEPGVFVSIVAPGGTGKTTLEGTALESEFVNKLVLMDANANAQVLTDPPEPKQLIHVRLNNWEHIDAIVDEFMSGGHRDTDLLCWDNVSASYDQNYNDWHQKYKDGRKAYGMAQSDLTVTIRKLLILAEGKARNRGRPLHIILIFQEVTEEGRLIPNETTMELEPAPRREINLSNKMQALLPSMVPFMGFMSVTKNEARILDFRAANNTQAKWQSKQTELFKSVPRILYKPNLGPLFDTLVGGKPFPKERFRMPAPVITPNAARKQENKD